LLGRWTRSIALCVTLSLFRIPLRPRPTLLPVYSVLLFMRSQDF
jgi:hypothetical protein